MFQFPAYRYIRSMAPSLCAGRYCVPEKRDTSHPLKYILGDPPVAAGREGGRVCPDYHEWNPTRTHSYSCGKQGKRQGKHFFPCLVCSFFLLYSNRVGNGAFFSCALYPTRDSTLAALLDRTRKRRRRRRRHNYLLTTKQPTFASARPT